MLHPGQYGRRKRREYIIHGSLRFTECSFPIIGAQRILKRVKNDKGEVQLHVTKLIEFTLQAQPIFIEYGSRSNSNSGRFINAIRGLGSGTVLPSAETNVNAVIVPDLFMKICLALTN